MVNFEYNYRPAVLFKKGVWTKTNSAGDCSVVAIIGAFPCVSDKILSFTDLDEARKALNITAGVHDVEYKEVNGKLVKNDKYYYGAGALKQAFLDKKNLRGASKVIVCNISTYKLTSEGEIECETDGKTRKYNTTLIHSDNENGKNYELYQKIDFDKLKIAFSKLKKEKFHNLIFAFPLDHTDEYKADIKLASDGQDKLEALLKRYLEWTQETYTVQHPVIAFFGATLPPAKATTDSNSGDDDILAPIGLGGSQSDAQDLTSVVDSVVDSNFSKLIDTTKAEKYYKVFSDPKDAHSLGYLGFVGTYDEDAGYILNPVETAAQYAGFLCGRPVDQSMTQKVIDTVKGVGLMEEDVEKGYIPVYEELNFDPTDDPKTDGFRLIKAGGTMFECTNREGNEYSVVNSMLPCGFDISHIRTSAYIIEQITLNPFLGNVNRDTSINAIDSVIASIKNTMIGRFPVVESIEHAVAKVSPTCVKIRLHINFYGIIINEIVYVTMSVEGNERMVV